MEYAPPIHASAFVYEGIGCLIVGKPGSGKSRLLSEMLMFGARLIADDQVRLCTLSGKLVASPVPQLEGVISLRGLGLIKRADVVHSHPIHLALELDTAASLDTGLAPVPKDFLGQAVPSLLLPPPPVLSVASIPLYLKAMQEHRVLPPDWRP